MLSLFTFTAERSPCGYLPGRDWALHYEIVGAMTAEEYAGRLVAGWRRFGHSLFRPACPECAACQSLRVPVTAFKPNQSQTRAWAANPDLRLEVGPPEVTAEKLDLYERFHSFQAESKGWPESRRDAAGYRESFAHNPFASQEWCYYAGGRLVGVGYVDALPGVGLSAIYFYYDPAERKRSLGTYNVLALIRAAKEQGLPHLYLGYFVAGCRSLEYKAKFRPNEVFVGGAWGAG